MVEEEGLGAGLGAGMAQAAAARARERERRRQCHEEEWGLGERDARRFASGG
jgi:hypothetical protein